MIVKQDRYDACGRPPIHLRKQRWFDFARARNAALARNAAKRFAMSATYSGGKFHAADSDRRHGKRDLLNNNNNNLIRRLARRNPSHAINYGDARPLPMSAARRLFVPAPSLLDGEHPDHAALRHVVFEPDVLASQARPGCVARRRPSRTGPRCIACRRPHRTTGMPMMPELVFCSHSSSPVLASKARNIRSLVPPTKTRSPAVASHRAEQLRLREVVRPDLLAGGRIPRLQLADNAWRRDAASGRCLRAWCRARAGREPAAPSRR